MAFNSSIVKQNKKVNMPDVLIFTSLCLEVILCVIQSFSLSSTVNEILFFNSYVLLIGIIFYFLSVGFNKHFLIFAYVLCFALFLMGQKVFKYAQNGGYDEFLTFVFLKLNTAQYFLFTRIMFFSLFTLFAGYRLGIEIVWEKRRVVSLDEKTEQNNKSCLLSYRTILTICLFICFACSVYMQLKIVRGKSSVSYTDSYLMNVDVNPIIKIGNYLFTGMVFLYLSTKPTKRQVLILLTMFLIVEGGLQLLVGRRALLAKALLFIVWYFICYYKYDRKKMPYKYFIFLAFFAVLIIILFWLVERSRSSSDSEFKFINAISSFFTSTGGSDSVIANTIDKVDDFPKDGIVYFFNPIKEALFDNVLIRKILSIISGTASESLVQGIDYVNAHDSFSHWISYLVNSELYCNGYGMGSSYIAELYLAFGFLGVCIGGLLLGIAIAKLASVDLSSYSVFGKAIKLFFIYNLFTLPRSGTFETATSFLYFISALLIFKSITFVLGLKIRS